MIIPFHCRLIKVAHTKMSPDQVVENVSAALKKLWESLPGGGDNVKSMHLKTDTSPALPIYKAEGNFF